METSCRTSCSTKARCAQSEVCWGEFRLDDCKGKPHSNSLACAARWCLSPVDTATESVKWKAGYTLRCRCLQMVGVFSTCVTKMRALTICCDQRKARLERAVAPDKLRARAARLCCIVSRRRVYRARKMQRGIHTYGL